MTALLHICSSVQIKWDIFLLFLFYFFLISGTMIEVLIPDWAIEAAIQARNETHEALNPKLNDRTTLSTELPRTQNARER